METYILTIDEIRQIKNSFLRIDHDLNMIHSVDSIKDIYYSIHAVAILFFMITGYQTLAESAAFMLLIAFFCIYRWRIYQSRMIVDRIHIFSRIFTETYAYELLNRLTLDDQDYLKIRHIISDLYKKERV